LLSLPPNPEGDEYVLKPVSQIWYGYGADLVCNVLGDRPLLRLRGSVEKVDGIMSHEQSDILIDVNDLRVQYGKGSKTTHAVKGISFQIRKGECVGFIGANGAGKSTTIKTIMGFMFPSSGSVKVFGLPAGSAESRERIGCLPEVVLYYPFMKARELLELYGGLSGIPKKVLKERTGPILEKVGLGGKGESLLRSFSKGMQQRLGIAQSLIGEPDMLIFDELCSGLDPLGRHDLREVLKELKATGRTIFFSSHELTEVETLCDRILMIHQGQIVKAATLEEIQEETRGASLESYFIKMVGH
jgi:ABC-2 type transport system ATP-binding protein